MRNVFVGVFKQILSYENYAYESGYNVSVARRS